MRDNTRTENKNKDTDPKSARRSQQCGAALVETALVFMTVLGMILFILDMGRILLSEQFISERARVGARNAVVNNWTSTQVANYVVYGSTTAPDGNPPGFLGLLPSQVTLTSYADSGINDGRYQVTVTGVPLFTWIPYIRTVQLPNRDRNHASRKPGRYELKAVGSPHRLNEIRAFPYTFAGTLGSSKPIVLYTSTRFPSRMFYRRVMRL